MIANEEIMIAGETPPEIVEQCMARYRFAAPFAEGRRVLDIGCAGGHGSGLLARAGATEVVAVDIAQEAVCHASGQETSPDVLYVCADITRSPFRGRFDLVVAFEVIEHCEEPDEFLATVGKMLTDDGLLLISTPNARRREYTDYRHPNHHFEWLPDEFREHLQEHFEEVSLYGLGRIPAGVGRTMRRAAVRIDGRTPAHRGLRRVMMKLSDVLGYRIERGTEVRELDACRPDIPMGQLAVCQRTDG